MSSNASSIRYIPEEHERAYYQGLFKFADTAGRGQIGGAEAVQFFTRSKLPVETLKNIWTVADQPPSNYLDLPKFAVAIRLIQCMQNGQRGQGANLATPPGVVMWPAMFDGVSGVQVPLPPESGGGGRPTPTASPTPSQQQPQQQYQQAPPTPQQQPQQQYQQAPPTPQQYQQQPPPSSSTALTVQDQYAMGPNDYSRYEGIFQEYGKEDGYLYGQEAVELFSKSGMPKQALATIWNMVDQPVDNRLDKVEFAIAMHLIVCVSKKSMPMPPSLPASLVQLKQQKMAQQKQYQHQHASPPQQSHAPPNQAAAPSQQQPPQYQSTQQQSTDSAAAAALAETANSSAAAVLPQASLTSSLRSSQGGMSISDAFEGLSTDPLTPEMLTPMPEPVVEAPPPAMPPSPEPAPVYVPEPAVSAAAPTPALPAASMAPHVPASSSYSVPVAPEPAVPAAVPSASTAAAGSELTQMRELLQKLQAENISLKAQLSGSSEDERDVQKELAVTISEVARLSSVLSGLRQQVAAQKSRLADLTATLKSAKDNTGLLNSLIAEETATKEALEYANQTMMSAVSVGGAPRTQPQAPEDMFSTPAPPLSVDYGQPPPQAQLQPRSSSFGESTGQSNNNSVEMTLDTAGLPAAIPEVSSNMESSAASPPNQEQTADPISYSQQGQYDYSQQQQQFQYPSAGGMSLSAPNSAGSHHKRDMSTASAFGFHDGDFMGGEPLPTVDGPSSIDFSSSASATAAAAQQKPPAPPSVDFEEMRKKAKEADDIARDAEENSRSLLSKLGEARRVAEEAEAALTKHRKTLETSKEKKKGLFGGGGSKQQKKEAAKVEQNLALEAKKKKDELLQLQGRANDAQAFAMETRREADRLQQAAEEAEIAQAAANSLDQPPSSSSTSNGTARDPSEQQPQPPSKTYFPPAQQPSHDASQPAPAATPSFHPNVMAGGGGGFSIPEPDYSADAYSNPFDS